ncbi:5966_t:CDS:2, partial [Acaulospora colombiana]
MAWVASRVTPYCPHRTSARGSIDSAQLPESIAFGCRLLPNCPTILASESDAVAPVSFVPWGSPFHI